MDIPREQPRTSGNADERHRAADAANRIQIGLLIQMHDENYRDVVLFRSALQGNQDGTGQYASFDYPSSVSSYNNLLYATDYIGNQIRKIIVRYGNLMASIGITVMTNDFTEKPILVLPKNYEKAILELKKHTFKANT